MNNKLMNTTQAQRGLVAALAFMLPFLSLVTLWGFSLSSSLFLLAALFYFKPCRAALAQHWPAVRGVLGAFLTYFLFAAWCLVLRPDAESGDIEKPVRMLFAVSALALVIAFRPRRSALWWGVIGGAVGGALLVGFQRLALGMDRPGGLLNAITIGDLLVCFALVALAALAGALATGTRGSLVAAGYAILQTGFKARVAQGVIDVRSWYAGGSAYTNMGIRMELWKAAGQSIAERPLLGRSLPEARREMARRVAQGTLDPVVLPAVHFHNDVLHMLVTGGVAGLAAWLSILAAPLIFLRAACASAMASALRRPWPACWS